MRSIALALCLWSAVLLSGCAAGLDGRLILSDADRRQAVVRYQEALAREPGNWLLHRRLGLVQFALKDYAPAEKSFQEVLALSPGEPLSLLYLGLSRIGKGEREAGLAGLEAFRWPGKFYHQKFVQEEAARLRRHPEAPAEDVIGDILKALEDGRREQDRMEQDMFQGLS